MSKPYYVKVEIPKEIAEASYEALRQAKQTGKIRKGTNEATKAIERGIAKLVVISEDVDPPEVVAHLPIICEERKAAYTFVPSRQELGKALGIEVTCGAAAILDSGDAKHIIDQINSSIEKIKGGTSDQWAQYHIQKN